MDEFLQTGDELIVKFLDSPKSNTNEEKVEDSDDYNDSIIILEEIFKASKTKLEIMLKKWDYVEKNNCKMCQLILLLNSVGYSNVALNVLRDRIRERGVVLSCCYSNTLTQFEEHNIEANKLVVELSIIRNLITEIENIDMKIMYLTKTVVTSKGCQNCINRVYKAKVDNWGSKLLKGVGLEFECCQKLFNKISDSLKVIDLSNKFEDEILLSLAFARTNYPVKSRYLTWIYSNVESLVFFITDFTLAFKTDTLISALSRKETILTSLSEVLDLNENLRDPKILCLCYTVKYSTILFLGVYKSLNLNNICCNKNMVEMINKDPDVIFKPSLANWNLRREIRKFELTIVLEVLYTSIETVVIYYLNSIK